MCFALEVPRLRAGIEAARVVRGFHAASLRPSFLAFFLPFTLTSPLGAHGSSLRGVPSGAERSRLACRGYS